MAHGTHAKTLPANLSAPAFVDAWKTRALIIGAVFSIIAVVLAFLGQGQDGLEMARVRVFRARVVDLAAQSLVVEITGTEEKIQALVEVLRPYGILEMARTGQVVMSRGARRRPDDRSGVLDELSVETEASQSV